MQPDEVDEHVDVGGLVAHARGHDPGHRDAVVGVVAEHPLPEVVQQRAHQQQVGPAYPAHVLARAGHGFEQVAVHRELVERVALRPEAHRLPLGEEPDQEPVLVEQLELRHGGVAAAQQCDERHTGLVAPRIGHDPGLGVEATDGRPRDGHTEVCGIGGGTQHERGVGSG